MEVKVPIISNIACRETGYGKKITDNMLCAGFPEGMKDSCQVIKITTNFTLFILGLRIQ